MRIFIAATIFCVFCLQPVQAENSNLWKEISTANKASVVASPVNRRLYRADNQRLTQILTRADMEGRGRPSSSIELPVANGEIQLFSVEESPIMADGLAAKYPSIKTYKIRGIDDPASSGRLSMSAKGLNGMITGPSGSFFIDAQSDGVYSAYRKNKQQSNEPFHCGVSGHNHDNPLGDQASRPAYRTPSSLRVYRLAVAATSEYVSTFGGTTQGALEEIVKTINRVNQIYQLDLGIKLELIDSNDLLMEGISQLPSTYSNFNALAMLDENQKNLDAVIRSKNYDIGHVFGTGGGGIAEVGSVCNSFTKAGGVTGLTNPTGDAFYIDYVAHEIGHQFGAEHSFNGTTSSCSNPNRWQASAFEPGGGSTIMSYAGICGLENITIHADAMFHAGSIAQIDAFTTSGTGASCGIEESINNPSEPTATAGNDYLIPVSTPFVLTGGGNDVDGDTLSYSWDQMDAGVATNFNTLGLDLGDNALMRSRLPQATGTRYFPQLDSVLLFETDKAEVLPTTSRDLNFRLTIRDGYSGIGQDDVVITSTKAAGPFQVTSHNTVNSLSGNSIQTVLWDVAGTNNVNSINCSHVDIDLLMMNNSETTFCEEALVSSVPNNGSSQVTLPDLNIPKAHFRVSCSNNIFYAISKGNISVSGNIDAQLACQSVVPQFEDVYLFIDQSLLPDYVPLPDLVPLPEESSSGGSFSLYWLLSLFSVLIFHRVLIGRRV